ncbi:AaceriAER423Cp [[Ashbya] aceris (nom. inval.)]|nr:AaceriAER423Cp [[Ashbya] aceris (nom. inval.)]
MVPERVDRAHSLHVNSTLTHGAVGAPSPSRESLQVQNAYYHQGSRIESPPESSSMTATESMRSSMLLHRDTSYSSLRNLSLYHLTAKQHFLIAICRDISLLPPICSAISSLRIAWEFLSAPEGDRQYPLSVVAVFRRSLLKFVKRTLRQQIGELGDVGAISRLSAPRDALDNHTWLLSALRSTRSSEYLLCSLWCLVSMYLSYSILDSLMVRWIMKYSTFAAILRIFSMSLMIVTVELLLLSSLSPNAEYYLHSWILISCILTGVYIWQSFLTSNLSYIEDDTASTASEPSTNLSSSAGASIIRTDSLENTTQAPTVISAFGDQPQLRSPGRRKRLKKFDFSFSKKRSIDLYNITVFCVVPVGLASFVTMLGLLRNLIIQRLDVEQLDRLFKEMSQE